MFLYLNWEADISEILIFCLKRRVVSKRGSSRSSVFWTNLFLSYEGCLKQTEALTFDIYHELKSET